MIDSPMQVVSRIVKLNQLWPAATARRQVTRTLAANIGGTRPWGSNHRWREANGSHTAATEDDFTSWSGFSHSWLLDCMAWLVETISDGSASWELRCRASGN